MDPFVERHQDNIAGVPSCFVRLAISGTLPDIGYACAMAGYLRYHKIWLFDYPRWAEALWDELRNHAEQFAIEAGIEIEFIRRHKAFRKEDQIKANPAGWSTSSPPWNPAPLIAPDMTRTKSMPFTNPPQENASITTSTSSMSPLGAVTCGCHLARISHR
jgi:hypothetical protein